LDIDALVLQDVTSGYGQAQVLHGVSFGVGNGRVLALLGRNGVGKSTCINTIVGFLRASAGEIRLHGERITALAPERIVAQGIGLVPQGRRIFPTLTVQEHLRVAARPPRGPARTAWTSARVFDLFPRLADRRRHLAGNLSGGEQQMLAIGRALMTNPRVLLLDEPSEGLAPRVVHELCETLLLLKRESLSVMLVEQNSALALDVADDALILGSTGIGFRGSADELKSNPELLNRQLGVC